MHTFWQDLRYGMRMLLKNPGFTCAAIITLALGVGANTSVFTVVNTVLLRSLPYPGAERLMQVGRGLKEGQVFPVSEPKFLYWRDHNQSFEAMTAVQSLPDLKLSGEQETEYVPGLMVSHEFFRVMGLNPVVGRGFTQAEERAEGERVVVLSDGLWRRRFGADAGLIGQNITLNSESYTVIGVMPPDFRFLWPVETFVPLHLRPGSRDGAHNFSVIGRLKPGVAQAQATAELKQVAESFRAEFPTLMQQGETISFAGVQELMVGDVRKPLLILFGAVGFVLLIACANVANLQLSRSASRRKEIAIRLALGVSWSQIVRLLLTEGMMLSCAGGVAGLLLALWGVDSLVALTPPGLLPRAEEIHFDWRVLVFAFGTAIITGLIFSLAPAIQAARVDVNRTLKESSGKGGTAARSSMRSALVIAEITLSLVLLTGAALLVRTFTNLRRIEPGFDPNQTLTFRMKLSGASYDTAAKTAEFYRRALERLRALPGVDAAAVTSNLPLQMQFNMPVMLAGQTKLSSAQYRLITPDYFRAMKMSVRQGRPFTEADNSGNESVIIVNEAFARRYFQNTNVLGQRICAGCKIGGDPAMRTIVGVVSDTKQFDLISNAPAAVFIPIAQAPDQIVLETRSFLASIFVLRVAGDPLALSAAVKREMLSLDPTTPISNLSSLTDIMSATVASERFNLLVLGLFAGIGLMLAAVGIYGVMAYTVAQSTSEIGIRIALGAQSRDVMQLFLGRGMFLALIGLALGLAASFGLTRLMKSLLFGVTATDPLAFASVAVLLIAIALLACYLPARRATQVEPIVALRYE